tara:strand:+ start:671 stop:997 length:327 start_codon:yes stop_codon:yes gene_type:complete
LGRFGRNHQSKEKDPYGKMQVGTKEDIALARNSMKKALLKQAATNRITEFGPSTATEIAYYGRTDNGRLLKDYKTVGISPQQAFNWLRVDADFTIIKSNMFKMRVTNG